MINQKSRAISYALYDLSYMISHVMCFGLNTFTIIELIAGPRRNL